MKKFFTIVFATLTLEVAAQTADNRSNLIVAGTTAPAFTLEKPDGTSVSLDSFRGKYILIDFWASWCPDCRKSNPVLVQLHDSIAGEKLAFLGISFDTDRKAWTKCIEKDSLAWTHASELRKWKETSISKAYGIKWIPTFYLIDPKGRVVFAALDKDELKAKLADMDF